MVGCLVVEAEAEPEAEAEAEEDFARGVPIFDFDDGAAFEGVLRSLILYGSANKQLRPQKKNWLPTGKDEMLMDE